MEGLVSFKTPLANKAVCWTKAKRAPNLSSELWEEELLLLKHGRSANHWAIQLLDSHLLSLEKILNSFRLKQESSGTWVGGYWFLKPLYGIRSYDITLKPEPSRVRTFQDQEDISLSGPPLLLNRWVSCDLETLLFGLAGTSWHIAFLPWDEWREEHMNRESWGQDFSWGNQTNVLLPVPKPNLIIASQASLLTLEGEKCHCYSGRWNLVLSCPVVSTVAVTLFQMKWRNCW